MRQKGYLVHSLAACDVPWRPECEHSLARCLARVHFAKSVPQRNDACRMLLVSLSQWVPQFVGKSLRAMGPDVAHMGLAEISDDALQHLAIRIVQGRATEVALSDDALAKAWCKRVVLNYLRDEVRICRKRIRVPPPPVASLPAQEEWVTLRNDVRYFLASLRGELARSSRPRDLVARNLLVDEFLAGFDISAPRHDACPATASRRKRRGRSLASRAWVELRQADPNARALDHVAVALGLELGQGASTNPSSRDTDAALEKIVASCPKARASPV